MSTSQAQQVPSSKRRTGNRRRAHAPTASTAEAGVRRTVPAWNRSEAAFDRFLVRAAPGAAVALRLSLGLVFVWFGALKLAGDSPVVGLVSATLPWADPQVVVPVLGAVEVALGIGLLVGKARRLLLLALATHLAGTFLTFLMAPALTVQGGNPLLLTADGEFVLKNAVLISAAILLACTSRTATDAARQSLDAGTRTAELSGARAAAYSTGPSSTPAADQAGLMERLMGPHP
jgi:putative oxidoreductase